MSYTSFKNEWSGRRIDWDKVYAYQCVDLILQYIYQEYGIASGVWGNAIDYANPNAILLNKFDKISGTDCKQGDIIVLRGLAGNPYGHIGICDSDGGSTVRILEQNGAGSSTGVGRDAIGVYRDINKSRIAAVLRPKAPVSIPTPPAGRKQTVTLPAHVQSWRAYRIGSGLRPNTSDQVATLAPSQFGGLTYAIDAWVGDYAVVIQTQMFGRVVIWVKGTDAIIK